MTSSETWIKKYFTATEQQAWAELLPLAEIELNRTLSTEQDEETAETPFTDFRPVKVNLTEVLPPLR
jgi:hypothetical protein